MSDQSHGGDRPDQSGERRRDASGRQRPERKHGNLERSVTRPAERSRSTDPARLAAYTVMRAVADGAYANLELPKELRDKGIRGRDAAFATELTYGATRLRGLYDPIIAAAAGRPGSATDQNGLDTPRRRCPPPHHHIPCRPFLGQPGRSKATEQDSQTVRWGQLFINSF